jgi:hypothetical protein
MVILTTSWLQNVEFIKMNLTLKEKIVVASNYDMSMNISVPACSYWCVLGVGSKP